MFTGIVDAVGRIRRLDRPPDEPLSAERLRSSPPSQAARLEIEFEHGLARAPLVPGLSVAVNGCCLTVVEVAGDAFAADLSAETLRRTSFGELAPGALVNLERPLAAGAELGGHFVLGHVDGVGRIERLVREGGDGWLSVRVPPELERYVAMKGSFAVDGISLTVASCGDGLAEFAVVPYTFAHTNLRERSEGAPVNLECDVLARYIERLMDARAEPVAARITLERLIEEGF